MFLVMRVVEIGSGLCPVSKLGVHGQLHSARCKEVHRRNICAAQQLLELLVIS